MTMKKFPSLPLSSYRKHLGGVIRLFPSRDPQVLQTLDQLPEILSVGTELGMTRIRTRIDISAIEEFGDKLHVFKDHGMRVCLVTGHNTGLVGSDVWRAVDAFGGAVDSVEGYNEPFNFNTADLETVRKHQAMLYVECPYDIHVLGPSIIVNSARNTIDASGYYVAGAEYANTHQYPASHPERYMKFNADKWRKVHGPSVDQVDVTEFGYDSPTFTLEEQSKYLLRLYLEQQRHGYRNCYMFRLKEHVGHGAGHGLLDQDLNLSQAADGFAQMAKALPIDTGINGPSEDLVMDFPFSYSTRCLVYQGSSGMFYIVVWRAFGSGTVDIRFGTPGSLVRNTPNADGSYTVSISDIPSVLYFKPVDEYAY